MITNDYLELDATNEALNVKAVQWRFSAEKPPIFIEYTYARECENTEEAARLEKLDPDLAKLYQYAGPCDPSDYAAYGRLIGLRYDFLHQNATYRQYCEAIKNSDTESQSRIELLHPKIAGIFSDWGYSAKVEIDKWEWIEANRDLFYPFGFTTSKDELEVQTNRLTLSFPTAIRRARIPFEEPPYTMIDRFFSVASDAARRMNASPKYEIRKLRGETDLPPNLVRERLGVCG